MARKMRREERRQIMPPGLWATAQELHRRRQGLRIRIQTKIRIATLTIRGAISVEKKAEMERWMRKRQMDILCLQENA